MHELEVPEPVLSAPACPWISVAVDLKTLVTVQPAPAQGRSITTPHCVVIAVLGAPVVSHQCFLKHTFFFQYSFHFPFFS